MFDEISFSLFTKYQLDLVLGFRKIAKPRNVLSKCLYQARKVSGRNNKNSIKDIQF
jgi:hypothetical protein